jgi:hypothetical protein
MRVAHVIFAYKDPNLIERFINAMQHPDFDFYIHLDKKINIRDFEYLSQIKQVFFVKNRTLCNWGGFSLVKAMMRSIDEIQATNIKYDFINILSGQDYPIKPINQIHDFFANNIGYSFIQYEESIDSPWWVKAEERYKKFHFTDYAFLGRYKFQYFINEILPERKFPKGLNLYGGSKATWCTLSYDGAVYISAYLKQNTELRKFLRFTWACDEFALITILKNSVYKDKIINESYRYIEFPEGKSQPRILGIDDYYMLKESKKLFGRKFDSEIDTNILDKLDSYVIENK